MGPLWKRKAAPLTFRAGGASGVRVGVARSPAAWRACVPLGVEGLGLGRSVLPEMWMPATSGSGPLAPVGCASWSRAPLQPRASVCRWIGARGRRESAPRFPGGARAHSPRPAGHMNWAGGLGGGACPTPSPRPTRGASPLQSHGWALCVAGFSVSALALWQRASRFWQRRLAGAAGGRYQAAVSSDVGTIAARGRPPSLRRGRGAPPAHYLRAPIRGVLLYAAIGAGFLASAMALRHRPGRFQILSLRWRACGHALCPGPSCSSLFDPQLGPACG